ncbi:hypothetical protein ACWEQL_32530 [Kitasatospora sp. NPDC004240]
MTDATPYDAARAAYTRRSLARLVLSSRAAALSDTAAELVPTRYDEFTGSGGRASETAALVTLADQLLVAAVVYERETGASWEDIAQYLGLAPHTVAARFEPDVALWHQHLAMPYGTNARGQRTTVLHQAAYDPDCAAERLDSWAHRRLTLFDDRHSVSTSLRGGDSGGQRGPEEIGDWIYRDNLQMFVGLLSLYIGYDGLGETDWEAITLGLESTDEDPDRWYTYALVGPSTVLDLTIAQATGGNEISIRLPRPTDPVLAARIETLLDAL